VAPALPYIDLPLEIPIPGLTHLPEAVHGVPILGSIFTVGHPPSIKLFGILVAFGVWLGSVVAMRHARERNIDDKKMSEFIFFTIGFGFVGAHVLDAIFYHPDAVARDPFYILKLWEGISSYGGFIGAGIAAYVWRYRHKQNILNFCECINSAFPLAWVFGRLGCSSVHDHPGKESTSWLAVKYPHLPEGVGKFDLGLLEFFYAVPMAIIFLILWRRRPDRPLGFYTGWMCVCYAPVRFCLDFLREEGKLESDPRYGGLTPAQWACFALVIFGAYFIRLSMRGGSSMEPERKDDDAPSDDEDDDDDADDEAEVVVAKPKPARKRRRRPA
jgi:phosphatidylglycerol:prolipoprotein diacylglycerol transferase